MLRFTIRDLFWATLVVAVGLACVVRGRQLRNEAAAWQKEAHEWRDRAAVLQAIRSFE
jgi:hypothetical protein